MQEFLRRGGRDQRGLDDLARRVAERRRDLLQRHNLDGTLQEVRELLEHAVLEERKQLARDVDLDDSDRAFREMQLDNLPSSTAAAVSELSDYDWQSSEAREDYEKIKDLLGRELLDQRFAGMKQAMENATDEDRQRVNEMLTDLNRMLEAHRLGEDTDQMFSEFMDKHGDFFPENPQNIDELLDALAQRSAAAQRMMNSMTRRAARRADGPVPAGVRLARADAVAVRARRQPARAAAGRGLGRLRAVRRRAGARPRRRHRRTAGPGRPRRPVRAALAVLRRRPDGRRRPRQARPPARRRGLGRRPHARRAGEGARATPATSSAPPTGSCGCRPKAMRQLGKALLRDVAQRMSGRQGNRDMRHAGAAGERSGATPRVGVRRHRAVGRHPHGDQRRRTQRRGGRRHHARRPARDRRRRGDRDRGAAPRRRSRCWSTRRSRWRWTAAGCR